MATSSPAAGDDHQHVSQCPHPCLSTGRWSQRWSVVLWSPASSHVTSDALHHLTHSGDHQLTVTCHVYLLFLFLSSGLKSFLYVFILSILSFHPLPHQAEFSSTSCFSSLDFPSVSTKNIFGALSKTFY